MRMNRERGSSQVHFLNLRDYAAGVICPGAGIRRKRSLAGLRPIPG
jgi:hypothetical protein